MRTRVRFPPPPPSTAKILDFRSPLKVAPLHSHSTIGFGRHDQSMRELTDQTRALIAELHELPKRRFGLTRKRNVALAELLWKIADASEPAALPEILSLILEKHEPVARAAAK